MVTADKAAGPGRKSALAEVRFGEDEGRRVLLVDGAVQSVGDAAAGGYWAAMVPLHRPRRALLLGLGVGTVARLLRDRFGAVPTVGVDDDPAVIALARRELADLDLLQVVAANAFEYVASTSERFDLACVDLYRGSRLQAGVVSRPFLRSLKAILAPRGLATFNLYADRRVATRLSRIARVFRLLRSVPIGKNVVVWCRCR